MRRKYGRNDSPRQCPKYDKNGDVQKNIVFFVAEYTTSPREEACEGVMSGLLNFHSHDIVGLSVTEDEELIAAQVVETSC